MEYFITPNTKPRQTRSDKWNLRPCVVRYRAFADRARRLGITIEPGDGITFVIPIPKSWSKKKRALMIHQYHTQVPDLSNLLKAIEDAVCPDDSHLSHYSGLKKIWGDKGKIIIRRNT